ncbi:phospholipid scramblase-related protein [Nocardioides sediminis]|uniref:phospholipid scramblase-related protein n=1 Tax=Nocardioides sediminis TaxID=433648 RepID=UPI000D314CCE|nr:phospholipid scramblase-related protein [Nocardioides sediminis]
MSTWAPGWYPDPLGRHHHRYWDGREWTHHVGSRGQQGVDPVYAAPPAPAQPQPRASLATANQPPQPAQPRHPAPPARTDKRVQKQLNKLGVTDGSNSGDDSWLDEAVLVVHQKGKLLEVNAEYVVHDRTGRQVGSVREVGQSLAKKALTPTNRTRRFHVLDAHGRELVSLTRPTVWLKAKMIVRGSSGHEIGQIARTLSFDYSRFKLEAGGRTVGIIKGENSKQSDFSIRDASGAEIAASRGRTPAWSRRCSPRPTTTSSRYFGLSRNRFDHS